jgi:hypothetical protein
MVKVAGPIQIVTKIPHNHKPMVTANVVYMIIRNVGVWMKRRYDEIIAIFVRAMLKAYKI